MVNDPGDRTSIARGSYLNLVSRKFVSVSPARKSMYPQPFFFFEIGGINLRCDDTTSAKKCMFVGGPCSVDSDKTSDIFLQADSLSPVCTITFAIRGSGQISITPLPNLATHHRKKQSSAQSSPMYQLGCPPLQATEPPVITQDWEHNFCMELLHKL